MVLLQPLIARLPQSPPASLALHHSVLALLNSSSLSQSGVLHVHWFIIVSTCILLCAYMIYHTYVDTMYAVILKYCECAVFCAVFSREGVETIVGGEVGQRRNT